MRLVPVQRQDDLEGEVRRRFAEFNRMSSPSKGRRYPAELQAIAGRALRAGMAPSNLRQLTGVSDTTADRWAKAAKPVRPMSTRRGTKQTAPRRLEVVNENTAKRHGPVVVRLPSGVTIELAELSADLLATLVSLEVGHAASR